MKIPALLAIAIAWALPATVFGDIVVLKNGGQLHGQIMPADDPGQKTVVVRLDGGGQVEIDKSQVDKPDKQIVQSDAEKEYNKIAPTYSDTVEGQWDLAEWCRTHGLNQFRRTHLERVVELDTDHKEARAALGYAHLQGRWVRQDQAMKDRGYTLYKGKWMLPQEIEILKSRDTDEKAEGEWFRKLKLWRGWLNNSRAAQGKENILGIQDPYAAAALGAALTKEDVPEVKGWYIDVLSKLATPTAIKALADRSMDDPDKEVRITCLEQVAAHKSHEITVYYVNQLKSKDNVRVNRAGLALGYLKDPSTVGPLIEALITKHLFKVQEANPGQTSTTFGNGPGGQSMGMSAGGSGPKLIRQHMTNDQVLGALVSITGQNYSFDVKAWHIWFASAQKKPVLIDARRDDGK